MATESELIFEEILRDHKIYPFKIPRGVTRTPDYEITYNDIKSYWEIKELGENTDEQQILKDAEAGLTNIYTVNSKRIRRSICDAFKQFEGFNVTNYPCVIVLYDTRDFGVKDFLLFREIQNAMLEQGFDGSTPEINRRPGLLIGNGEFISAIVLMIKESKDLIFFHNPCTKFPLVLTKIPKMFTKHYYAKQTMNGMVWQEFLL